MSEQRRNKGFQPASQGPQSTGPARVISAYDSAIWPKKRLSPLRRLEKVKSATGSCEKYRPA
jgi:hypothetical protein